MDWLNGGKRKSLCTAMKRNAKKILKDMARMLDVALLLAFGLLVLNICSCSPCEMLARRCPPVEYVRDSIHVTDTCWFETIIVDTPMVVKLPPEYIYIVRPHHDTVKGETAFTRGMAWCDGESLNLELINKDSAEVLVQRIKTLERQLRYWQKFREQTNVKTEYRTRGIVKVFMGIGIAAVVLIFLYIILWILKRR